MQTAALSQGSLASTRALDCPQNNVRPVSSQDAAHFSSCCSSAPQLKLSLWGTTSRATRRSRAVVRPAQREDFAEVEEQEVESVVPSVLKFPMASGVAQQDTTSDRLRELQQTGTVKEVLKAASKAVADAPVQSVGQVALYGGMVAFGLLISGSVLNSIDHIPLAAETLQTVGVVYSVLVGSQVLRKKPVTFPPPSPFKAAVELVDGGQSKPGTYSLNLQEEVSKGVAAVLEKLATERDTAVYQVGELKKAAEKIASVLAEKEALEAVALQLADERDGAMSEVSALKDAIGAMTSRIKGIEDMLEQEVSQLKQQNQALETVSLQLAAERDAAIQEIEQLRSEPAADSQGNEEKEALEMVAIQLAQERDSARAEIEDLQKVVAILREATSTASGLTSEQEVFIKARIRDIRSQFIDLEHVYEEQKDEVDRFIGHLVEKYGAPRDWTADYIKQFLNSSATKLSPPTLSGSQVENLTSQTSRSS